MIFDSIKNFGNYLSLLLEKTTWQLWRKEGTKSTVMAPLFL
jgi:hypothetical protein